MRARALAYGTAAFSLSVAFACSTRQDSESVDVRLSPSILAPKGVLDNVQRLAIAVYGDSGVACDAAAGTASGLGANPQPIATSELSSSGCPAGARFCGDLQLRRSTEPRVFVATATSATGATVARGCASASIDRDTLDVAIRMVRFVPEAVCGNGQIEATEQCEPPGGPDDPLCDEACRTKEVLLIAGQNRTSPRFVWPPQTGRAGKLLTFVSDRTQAGNAEVVMRVLSDTFERYAEQGSGIADSAFPLPNDPSGAFPPLAEANNQFAPAATFAGTRTLVAFEDDSGSTLDIKLRSIDDALRAEQPRSSPTGINGPGGAGEPGIQSKPQVAAGPNGLVLVAWQDGGDRGRIVVRTYSPQTRELGAQNEVSDGVSNRNVSLAATSSGWIAVWESGTDVKVRAIGADGAPVGTEQTVNDASHRGPQETPVVGALPDGRYAVVWTDTGATGGADIFVQRYAASGTPIAGDQTTRLNDVVSDGEQTSPAIASTGQAGGAFVVAWADRASGDIRARLLDGGGGFLFNSVDGQSSEFRASVREGRRRANPTVAIGGRGPFVAIGWEDTSSQQPGIYGRRFPAPAR
jgi:hypothetical protein